MRTNLGSRFSSSLGPRKTPGDVLAREANFGQLKIRRAGRLYSRCLHCFCLKMSLACRPLLAA
jgi:hypothetical protein